jgi:hypothetical protein
MVQQSQTVNPAGNPSIQRPAPPPSTYTRGEYMKDLRKVATKSPPKQ